MHLLDPWGAVEREVHTAFGDSQKAKKSSTWGEQQNQNVTIEVILPNGTSGKIAHSPMKEIPSGRLKILLVE